MSEYIIKWNAGYGENIELIEAESYDEALNAAYEAWREDTETNADYDAVIATEELKEDYRL